MKLGWATLMLVMVMLMISAVSAEPFDGNLTGSFSDDLDASNGTVYLSDNVYVDHDITIDKSVRIIGLNVTFEGCGENALFTLRDGAQVTFENIRFANFTRNENGAVLDIGKSSGVILINCTFTDNNMAINNHGDLKIYDSYFYNNSLFSQNSYGGAISNDGKLYIENTVFADSFGPKGSRGCAIYNNGEIILNKTTITNSYGAEDSKGSALFNNNWCLMVDSVVENNVVERYNFNYMHGCVYNQGNMTGIGNVFRNNTGKYVKPNTWYEGSPTIYNVGNLNLTFNAFIGNVYFNGLSVDLFSNGARYISLDANWWGCNDNPIVAGKINEGNEISSWVVLDITPEYSVLDINDSVLIKAGFKLNNGEEIRNDLFSGFDITLFDGENAYKDSFLFNRTQDAGQYTVTARVCSFEVNATVDVGKIPVYIGFKTENITFPEDLCIEFTSNVNQNVTLMLNNQKYVVNMENYKGNLTVSGLDAGTYDLSVAYGGDEDHFKAFNRTTVTVNKMPVALTLENVHDIKTEEAMTARIILRPNVSPVNAQLYINGVFNKTIYLYDEINNLTFKNLKEGEYNITVLIAQSENYFAANATKTFNVGRYDPKLSVKVDDINMGENATVFIMADNFTGSVILSINGVNVTVFIKNDTNITLPNLEGGVYSISVIFSGDSQYLPSKAATTFKVIRNDPKFSVDIIRHDKKAKININVNENATGSVGLYINFDKYFRNLTNGSASFNVSLDSGTNYIFAFYDGDKNFENATYNTTVIIDEEFLIIAEDVEAFEYNNFTYSVILVEKNRITMPNRIVSIEFDGKIHNVITDSNGVGAITLNLAAGTYTIRATYLNQTITSNINVRHVSFDLNTNDIEFGQSESVEAIFNGNVTGNVSFTIGDVTRNVEISNSKAVLNLENLAIGRYEVSATYFNGIFTSAEVTSAFEVKRATPIVTVSAKNIAPGQRETIEITFINNLTGCLTVNVNGIDYQINITDSRASLSIDGLDLGVYEVLVKYGGNENFTAFTSSTEFAVRNQTSSIALSIDEVSYGEELLITALLDANATGKVTFRLSDRINIVEISNRSAQCAFKGLDAGTYRVDAEYEGDLNFKPSSAYGFCRILKADSTLSILTDEVELEKNIMIYAKLPANATGEVYFSMTGYYSPRAKQISDGSALWYISPLNAGRYEVVASYGGDGNYNPSNATFILKVSKVRSLLQVSINDATAKDRVRADVRLCDGEGNLISGNVTITLEGKAYNVNVEGGSGSLVLGRMNPAGYVFQAFYGGSDEYSSSSVEWSFIVAENLLESSLTAENVTAFYKGLERLKITLTSNGKAISQALLNVKVNGKVYAVTTDNMGVAALDLDLNPGVYTAEITFDETLSHKSSNATARITVLSTVNASDVVKLYGSGTQYFAIFYTSDGSALADTEVSFLLNGRTYRVKTLPNGVVRLNINIEPGTYKITAINPQTQENAVNSIRIYAKIMENRDLTQYYGANKYFKVRIYNATTGKPVGAGVKVTFKLNKKTYRVKTDSKGYAKLKITLKAGRYAISASYAGYKVSNTITVKPVLTASNIIAKNVKTLKFKAKLVDTKGKALKAKTVKFKFRGKTYSAKTNAKGIATITLKNLKAGKFTITSSYGGCTVKNTIMVKI